MNYLKQIFVLVALSCSILGLSGAEFTISSYNCGRLPDHYDYLRAVNMQKLMDERYLAEPEQMSQNEKIQQLALKILFSEDLQEKKLAQEEWDRNDYQQKMKVLIQSPLEANSPNVKWYQKAEQMITSYMVRPVILSDEEVRQSLIEHLSDLTGATETITGKRLTEARAIMAKRIFHHHLKFDIICLQEADYLDSSMFPETYEVIFSHNTHSINGIAWNKDRFELINTLGDIRHRAFALELRDKENGKTILVASGHISGCDPYRIARDPVTQVADSDKGDSELNTIIDLFDSQEADLKIIGMDSNVTSLHPRLQILKDSSYILDYKNFLEPTCTNPYQVLNTRIDWIALKTKENITSTITNIPVLSVGLNSLQTNMSDHKPIGAKIIYE